MDAYGLPCCHPPLHLKGHHLYLIYLNFNVVHFFGLIKLIKMVHREVVKLCENHAFLRALRISFHRDFRNILVGLENFQSSIL